MLNMNEILMRNLSRTGLTKTTSGSVGQQGAVGKYETVGRWRKRGGKRVKNKDGPEDGCECRNSKCEHYDWQRERIG